MVTQGGGLYYSEGEGWFWGKYEGEVFGTSSMIVLRATLSHRVRERVMVRVGFGVRIRGRDAVDGANVLL